MPAPKQVDPTHSVAELEAIVNFAEAKFYRDDKCVVYSLIAGAGPDEGYNKIVALPAIALPLANGIVVRTLPRTMDIHDVANAFDAIEQGEPLVLRHWSRAWVADEMAWVALFDKIPTATVVTKPVEPKFIRVEGKMSHFGGSKDNGMSQFEDTAFVENEENAKDYPGFFLPHDPLRPTGWGRRLNTKKHYIACRWDELGLSKKYLRKPTTLITVMNARTGAKVTDVRAIDAGPHPDTGRVADLSPAVEEELELKTDDLCVVLIPRPKSEKDSTLNAEDKPAATVAPGKRRFVFLTGDYSARAARARDLGCTWTVDFHFNAADNPAYGAEVYYTPDDKTAKAVAAKVLAAMNSLGLKNTRADPLQAATAETRAGYIRHYSAHALLLEPIFISEPGQNDWINQPINQEHLAQVVARALKENTTEEDLIGLSIGHLGKTSNPSDCGANAFDGRHVETDYNAPMARRVSEILSA